MKTIKCPECKKDLESVIEDRVQRAYWQVNLETADYQFEDYDNILESRYYCPECDEQLDTKEVEKLLK
jgi:uncharacterized protein YlaI